MKSTSDYQHIESLGMIDALELKRKGETYGDSWKQRGGVGAFMMLARKWDRLENQAAKAGYNIFTAVANDLNTPDGILDDIRDLRRYLLLVESEMTLSLAGEDGSEPTSAYVAQ